ncbi:hypothetical protein LBE40_05300 [Bartonella taylorii]|uniref:Uncharacterized protein n=2 Tax=Bartonella taylorii TaxID=33046 RepID=A0A9Q8YXQ2_BARTA|nr:hypothetical protein [Bartonella taylorii]EJF93043.1 hypothetical protein ME9_01485 [Bartonella taylorii 8TBB]OPB34634.1 hypothetical protein Btaycd_012240 [Bartonella taylorii]USP00716.1 hypothetical protein LBE40_05300 [Bartonella taylorii]USP02869.1 hypothetical protein LAJ60_08450 [Bartonella taylorii]
MGSSSSSRDSHGHSHPSSWFHSDSCDVDGYAYDVAANGIKGAVVGGLLGIPKGLSGIGHGMAIGAAQQGGNALINKIEIMLSLVK